MYANFGNLLSKYRVDSRCPANSGLFSALQIKASSFFSCGEKPEIMCSKTGKIKYLETQNYYFFGFLKSEIWQRPLFGTPSKTHMKQFGGVQLLLIVQLANFM